MPGKQHPVMLQRVINGLMMLFFCVVEMFASHKTSLKTDTLPDNIQLACNGDVLALPHARGAIAVWNLATESAEVFSCLLLYLSVYYFADVLH